MCFFGDVVSAVASERGPGRCPLHSEHGVHPIFEIVYRGQRVAFFQPGVGAPLAATFLEEAIDYAAVLFSPAEAPGAGCHPRARPSGRGVGGGSRRGHVVSLPAPSADRDRSGGRVGDRGVLVAWVCRSRPASPGRPTPSIGDPDKVSLRRAEGCITVEMEAAALLAVARFRVSCWASPVRG